ncbi:MAG: SPASM domain-containing protein [Theionarchaea archaeon]|nr:SPASM domain-containing protein [Theionarchaea archaeon]
MKPSFYNMFISLEDGSYALHNKLTGALLVVDEETKAIITNVTEREDEIDEKTMHLLRENGLILENHEDELLKIRYRYDEIRYNPQLVSFVIAPTSLCNLSCCYCVQRTDETMADKNPEITTMSDSVVESVLSFVKTMTEACNTRTLPICFHGGEPLMAKQLVLRILQDFDTWCREHSLDLKTSFFTNGTLFDESFIEEMQGYTLHFVRITFDGPEEIHNQFRHFKNGEGTYQKIVTNIGMLLDAKITVKVHININKYYNRIPELLDDLKERGLNNISVEPFPVFDPFATIPEIQKFYGVLDESFPSSESEYSVFFKDMVKARTYLYKAADKRGFKPPTSPLGMWTPCDGMRAYHFVVGPCGEVYKCQGCILMKNLHVGRIREDGFFEKYPLFHKWMSIDPTTIEKCQKCQYLPSCGGGCVAARHLGNLPYFCEVSSFLGEDYIKMSLKRKYPDIPQQKE